jgi:hypothetical protein
VSGLSNETIRLELVRVQAERDRLARECELLREALEAAVHFARPVDLDAALHRGGVDVRAALADLGEREQP